MLDPAASGAAYEVPSLLVAERVAKFWRVRYMYNAGGALDIYQDDCLLNPAASGATYEVPSFLVVIHSVSSP